MVVLGIETTCDETAAAVVERLEDGRGRILSNIVLSQISEHAAFGGVVPEIAARAHVEALDYIIAQAMAEAKQSFDTIDGVAAAAGPGLIGGVIVGLTTAKAIALVNEKPLIAVNHLEAHALTARLTDGTPFPYCLFLASGGHTQIVAVLGVGDYVRLGTTVDDAIGEAFDKTAKLLGLAYPGGPQVEQEALARRSATLRAAAADAGKPNADFSLSGLKTALRLEAEKIAPISDQDVRDLCASFQQAVVDVIADRLRNGLRMFREQYGSPTALVAAGGVAANEAIRKVLQPARLRGRHRAGRAAGRTVHRQRRDDRLGRRRAARARPDRHARHPAARALAALRCDVADNRPASATSQRGRRMSFQRIAVVGAGAWGAALANAIARAGRTVTLAARNEAGAAAIAASRESPHLPGVKLDERVRVVAADADIGQPTPSCSRSPRSICAPRPRTIAPALAAGTPVIACAKGIERGTHKFMTEVIRRERGHALAGDPVGAELRRRRRARTADRGDARRARRGGCRRARARARLRDVPALSLDRRARRRDRRRRQERAGDRRRHRCRPRARRQRGGGADHARLR